MKKKSTWPSIYIHFPSIFRRITFLANVRQASLRERTRKGLSVAAAHALLKIARDQWYTESVKVICEELEKGLGDLDESR